MGTLKEEQKKKSSKGAKIGQKWANWDRSRNLQPVANQLRTLNHHKAKTGQNEFQDTKKKKKKKPKFALIAPKHWELLGYI